MKEYACHITCNICTHTHPHILPWTPFPPPTVRLLTSGKLPQALISLYLRAIKPACCGAEIDLDSTAFVFSLANSESIFLTFFFISSPHTTSLFAPLLLLLLSLYPCSSFVHLYSPQTRVAPIASLHLILGLFSFPLLCFCVSPAGLSLSIPLFFLHVITVPFCSWSLIHLPGSLLRAFTQQMNRNTV